MLLPFRGPIRWLAAATLAVALLAAGVWANPIKPGLRASYYRSQDTSGTPALVTVQQGFSTAGLIDAWNGSPPETFSTAWSGSLLVVRSGMYTFRTVSDDGSWLYLDGTRVIDNGGQHGPQPASAEVFLERGAHGVRLEYAQQGGGLLLRWEWARQGGALGELSPVLIAPRRAAFWPLLASAALRRLLMLAEWSWIGLALTALVAAAWRPLARVAPALRGEGAWPMLPLLIAGSTVLNGAALWWGLPGGLWPPDELAPKDVAVAVSRHFAQGWFQRYPPFHFYVLALVHAPVTGMEAAGLVQPGSVAGETLRVVLGRLVSLAAGAGSLGLLFASARRLFGGRTALFAVAIFALVAPFVYYAKTTNLEVPYLFWFALAFWFLLALLERPRAGRVAGFACAATLSICTKDQAYGLFALPSLLVVHRLWQDHRQAGHARPVGRTLADRRLLAGVGAALLLFAACHNMLFNWSGFRAHVAIIVGGASQDYRMFPFTAAGERDLLRLTAQIVRNALGWPLLACVATGLVMAWRARRTRGAALVLTLPVVSYYLTFIAVVGYNYDRFLLPAFYLLAVFGGLALDRWLTVPLPRTVRLGLPVLVFGYSLAYVAAIDLLMLRDSRYTVERYLAAHAADTDRIGYVFPPLYSPRLDRWTNSEMLSLSQIEWERPQFFVLNDDYARTEPAGSTLGTVVTQVRSGALGYEPVFEARTPNPLPWLPAPHPDLTGPRLEGAAGATSSLRHINPRFVVWKLREERRTSNVERRTIRSPF